MMKKASKSIEFVSRKLLVNSKALSFIGKNGQVEWELVRTLAPLIDSVKAETGGGRRKVPRNQRLLREAGDLDNTKDRSIWGLIFRMGSRQRLPDRLFLEYIGL